MANKKITELQLVSAVTSDLNFPCDDTLQTYRATIAQLKTFLTPIYIPPVVQRITATGSGTFYRTRAFIASGASCTVGATYTHNSVTWTVVRTVSSSNIVYMSGNGTPLSSGTLTKSAGTGDSSIAFTEYRNSVYMNVILTGGGGGGGGAGGSATNGNDGADTTFTANLTAGKGLKGNGNAGGTGQGGSNSVSATTGQQILKNAPGGSGQFSGYATSATSTTSGLGGVSYWGGSAGNDKIAGANSGSGGGGGYNNGLASSTGAYGGDGGGAGGTLEAVLSDSALATSYSYSVGAGGTGGSGAGTGQTNGGHGAAGVIIVSEHFQ